MLIKICGVRDPKIAAFAAAQGADFIGCILTPGFARSVSLEQAKAIAEAARAHGAKPVAVFVGAGKEEIEGVCASLGITYVQAYELKEALSPALNRFYVNDLSAPLRAGSDFLLMESARPGSGQKIDLETFSPPRKRPWFIAGGLNPQNIAEAILRFHPDGVDVSSGVESGGVKDPMLVQQFIKNARQCG